jgi:hypothetical protein
VIAFLGVLIRIVFVLVLVRFVARFVAALVRSAAAPRAGSPAPAGELVRDRVCNTFLPRERAIAARIAGHEEHFCSTACRDRALAAVSRAS